MIITMATSGIWKIFAHMGWQTVVPRGNKGADAHCNHLFLQAVPKPSTWTTLKVTALGVHCNKAFWTDMIPKAFKDSQQIPTLWVLNASRIPVWEELQRCTYRRTVRPALPSRTFCSHGNIYSICVVWHRSHQPHDHCVLEMTPAWWRNYILNFILF